jgi:predicted DNA-binding transcriptional regulator AlpA
VLVQSTICQIDANGRKGRECAVYIGQMRERNGVSHMWVARKIKENGFPSPIKFGGKRSARHWRLPDLEAWEAERERALNPVSGPRSQRKRTAGKSEVDDLI